MREKMIGKDRTVLLVIRAIEICLNVNGEDIFLKSRKSNIAFSRKILYFMLRKYTKHSLINIGLLIGGRDHPTVISGLKSINNLIDTELSTRNKVDEIDLMIRNNINKENNTRLKYVKSILEKYEPDGKSRRRQMYDYIMCDN